MNEPAAGDIWRLQEQLESDASAILGRALFGFSRLDTNLGLMVASILRIAGKEGQALKVDEMNFHKRLEFVAKYTREAPDIDPRARGALTSWLNDADELRETSLFMAVGGWTHTNSKS